MTTVRSSMTSVLIIGYVWPEPRSSAAGTRMMQLIRLFRAQGWAVTFGSPAAQGEHREDLTSLGVQEVVLELNSSSFDEFVQALNPNIVLFDRFMMEEQFGWRVEAHCPQAVRILDTEDLHSLRGARQQWLQDVLRAGGTEVASAGDMRQLFERMAPLDLTQREVAAIYRCDLTLMISRFEMDLLSQGFGVASGLLQHCPFLLDVADVEQERRMWPDFSERAHFISIGNFRHAPNWDAVLYLQQSIWPFIRRHLPQAQLHVYGAYPPPKATALHNPRQGFHVLGWATDARAVMRQARICLAPLRFGAGLKGKLIDGMWCGTPSVTTPIGAEAMTSQWPWAGRIVSGPEAFAEAAVALYQDAESWHEAQSNGCAILAQDYDGARHGDNLLAAIASARENLDARRLHNFTGAMLRHHQHKSTQYMAKWIEAKNKLLTQ